MIADEPPSRDGPHRLDSSTLLLHMAAEGDQRAVELLVRRYLPALRRWTHGRLPRNCRALNDTDDLVQVALIRTIARLQKFRPRQPHAFLSYVRQALRNQIRDEVRRARRTPELHPLDDRLPDHEPTPLEETIGRDAAARYERALSRLPSDQLAAVVMRLELGFDYREVGDMLGGRTANAARLVVVRALVRLAKEMEANA